VKIKDREVGKISFERRKLMLWHRNDYNQALFGEVEPRVWLSNFSAALRASWRK
jgi:hypothetical protein